MRNPPKICKDPEGNPTKAYLTFLRKWSPSKEISNLSFIEILKSNWSHSSGVNYNEDNVYCKGLISTFGLSSNEAMIDALEKNPSFYFFLGYYKWERGGHYYFKFKL